MTSPTVASRPVVWRHGVRVPAAAIRTLPEEAAIAITYNRETFAVMMATPSDIADFAIGFSLTEGLIERATEIAELALVETPDGIEARMWLDAAAMERVRARRRRIAGPTGCGLCGIDSLREAVRPARRITAAGGVTPDDIATALRDMEPHQQLGRLTRAAHAAALWHPVHGLLHLREDVGRHNALDKLVGAAAQTEGIDHAACLLVLTSRVSIEMVQKACVLGVPVLVAISAPTAHAVRLATDAGITLVAVARPDGFEVFSGAERIASDSATHAA